MTRLQTAVELGTLVRESSRLASGFLYRSMTVKVTKILTVNIEHIDLTEGGKLVYRTMLKTGARTTEAIMQHLDMDEATVNLMLAYLLRYDLIEVK